MRSFPGLSLGSRPLVCFLLGSLFLVPLACAPEQPHYDEEIGLEAEPAEPGALAGTFALKTVNATLVDIPVLGEMQGGGVNFRLVTRAWNEEQMSYEQSSLLCGGYNVEVAGVSTNVPEETYRRVPGSTAETVEAPADGRYVGLGHLQLWALEFGEGEDPFTTPLPTTADEALEPEHQEHIYDIDEDGNPGLTMFVTGAVEGEVYAIQRKRVDLAGIVLGPDRAVGLADNRLESLMIANNNPLLDRQSEGSSEAHPDRKESWFEEVRLPEGSSCADVLTAADDGTLSPARPF